MGLYLCCVFLCFVSRLLLCLLVSPPCYNVFALLQLLSTFLDKWITPESLAFLIYKQGPAASATMKSALSSHSKEQIRTRQNNRLGPTPLKIRPQRNYDSSINDARVVTVAYLLALSSTCPIPRVLFSFVPLSQQVS